MSHGTLHKVDHLFYEWLELDTGKLDGPQAKADYGNTRKAAITICKQNDKKDKPPIMEAFNQIENNHLHAIIEEGPRPTRDKNYRWSKQLDMQAHNFGEKRLEKLAACILGKEWVNQVPVCSGFTWALEGGRRIDLAHKISEFECEFIELKYAGVNSEQIGGVNHPLFAAMEILQYGLVYLMARKQSLIHDGPEQEYLSNVEKINLVVLAPENFYEEFEMASFQKVVNDELAKLETEKDLSIETCLRCDVLSEDFVEFYREIEELIDSSRIRYEETDITSNDEEVNVPDIKNRFGELFPKYRPHFD